MRLVQDLVLFACLITLLGSHAPADFATPLLSLWQHVSHALDGLLR